MLYIITVLMILSLSLLLNYKFNVKLNYSFLIISLFFAIILYLFGLFKGLEIGVYFILIISLISFIYLLFMLIKKKIKIRDIFNLPTFIFLIISFILYILLLNTHYSNWDEFAHWGPNLKAMLEYDTFWANQEWNGTHIAYPPLIGLFEYLFCKINGGFNEGISYFAINIMILSALMIFIKDKKITFINVIKIFFLFFIIYTLMLSFKFYLTSIYIDFILGVMFFVSLYLGVKDDKNFSDKLLLIMLLFSLPLIKDAGLVLAGIILLEIFIKEILLKIIIEKKISKNTIKKLLPLIILLVVIFSGYLSFKIYCSINNIHVDFQHDANNIAGFNLIDYLKSITYFKAPSDISKEIVNNFYTALNQKSIIRGVFDTAILIVSVMLAYLIVLFFKEKNKKTKNIYLTIVLTLCGGFIIYSMFLLCIYLFALPTHEGLELASYTRYMSTFIIAFLLLILLYIWKEGKLKDLIIFFLIILSSINIVDYFDVFTKKEVSIDTNILESGEYINNNLTKKDKVYIIYQNNDGSAFNMLRFLIAPIKTNLLWEWSLGEPYNEKDHFTLNLSLDEWISKLKEEDFDYIYLGHIDDKFKEKYGELFEDEIKEGLYKIKKDMSVEYIG